VFDPLVLDLTPASHTARRRRLDRPDRPRPFGGGDDVDLGPTGQLLLTLVRLRHDPAQEALGDRFGGSDSSARRAIRRCPPVREHAGTDTRRRPDPGRGRRKAVPASSTPPRARRPR
jgi:hypothetical protein